MNTLSNLSATDRCVMCGLCLPHCPTYLKTLDEGDSPRGRIALMRALDTGQIDASQRLRDHLDGCVGCRACEAMCPSAVPFGALMDATRRRLRPNRRDSWRYRLGMRALRGPQRGLRVAARALRLCQRSGLRFLLRRSGLLDLTGLRRADAALPELTAPPSRRPLYPARTTARGEVALFTGCVTELADGDLQGAAIALLTALGWNVHIPPQQSCCGALHLHTGETEHAARMLQHNIEVFSRTEFAAVLSLVSGCGAQLAEAHCVPGLADAEVGRAQQFAGKVRDISDFLLQQAWPATLQLAPLAQRVAIHTPCTLRNVMRKAQAPLELLRRIPEIELIEIQTTTGCCGAGGSYFLTQAYMADALRADLLERVIESRAQVLVTSNIGCALHLAAGLRAAGHSIAVLHPIQLLARQLREVPP